MTPYHWRILLSLLLTIPLLWIGGGVFPPIPSSSMESSLFWTNKINPDQSYDMVIIGDSRIYRGIDPATIERELDSFATFRVFNFGFSSAGLDTIFMDAGAALLDSLSKHPIIVLGVSPSTLADENMVNTHYYQEKNRPKTELWQRKYINPYLSFFDPTSPTILKNAYQEKKEGYYQKHYLNGWIASTQIPKDVWKDHWMVIQGYEKATFSLAVRQNLIKKIKEWTKKGIKVFAFRPPAVEHFEKTENEYSKLSQKAIIAQIEAVGGTWIEVVDRYSYNTYDGNHLDEASAVRLSAFLGKTIKKELINEPSDRLHNVFSYFQDFEGLITKPWTEVAAHNLYQKEAYNGKTAQLIPSQAFSSAFVQPLDSFYQENLSIKTSCWMKALSFEEDSKIKLVVTIEDQGKVIFWEGQSFVEQSFAPRDWNKISILSNYKKDKKGLVLKVYVWNKSGSTLIMDDFKIEVQEQIVD